jgi:polyferredoxin
MMNRRYRFPLTMKILTTTRQDSEIKTTAHPSRLPRLRRISQIFFLALFLLLLVKTELQQPQGGGARLPYPVSLFLQLDPLAALTNALATRALYRGLLWSLSILVPTFILGRFFCGWICPLGTLNHWVSSWRSDSKRGARLIDSSRYKKWQATKYYLLIVLLVSAIFGGTLLEVLDPIPFLVRSIGLSILPAINHAANTGIGALFAAGMRPLATAAEILRVVLGFTVMSFKQVYFRQGFFLGALLVVVLALNTRMTRFWCRALCPLGALLGICSRWSIVELEKNSVQCGDCNRCLLHCQGGDDPLPGAKWRKSECHLCFNCVGECPGQGLRFTILSRQSTTSDSPQLQRRKAITSVAAGAVLLPILHVSTLAKPEHDARLIRPPGALDESHFLARCIRCGQCLKVCPNNALQPALSEAGFEGLWTPILAPRVGYCEPSCVLCGQVCFTGAIWEITPAEKGWTVNTGSVSVQSVRVGTAFYDHGRCLPWAMATDCIVCEEWCPTSPKAIYLVTVQVPDVQGNLKTVRQPHVDPARCVGCGACEYACPVKDRPAIYVTSIGETRSRSNQLLLKGAERGSA